MSKDIFVIYDKETSQILEVRNANGRRNNRYYGIGAAKAALTRYSKKSGLMPTDAEYPLYKFGIAEIGYYADKIEKQVERINMMTGKKYMESVNTPRYCSPSSESYWSM